jgi:hypothetical protein
LSLHINYEETGVEKARRHALRSCNRYRKQKVRPWIKLVE